MTAGQRPIPVGSYVAFRPGCELWRLGFRRGAVVAHRTALEQAERHQERTRAAGSHSDAVAKANAWPHAATLALSIVRTEPRGGWRLPYEFPAAPSDLEVISESGPAAVN